MRTLLALVLSLVSGTAVASELVVSGDFARVVVPATAHAKLESRTIYVNRHGGMIRPGASDSRTNTSSIVTRTSELEGWDASDAAWTATMDCLHVMWSRFDVVVTDLDPGQTPHIEAMVGVSSDALGLPRVGGVAPMRSDCGVVEHAMVFAFADPLRGDPRRICEVISQEVGHVYGLDHSLDAADPMSYLSYPHARAFQDRTSACGETMARPCGVGTHVCRSEQSSVQLLLERLGHAGADHVAPVLEVASPVEAIVAPGFTVLAMASDNVGVTSMTLYIDDVLVATGDAALELETDPGLAPGAHRLRIEAHDAAANVVISERAVTVEADEIEEPREVGGCSTGGASGLGMVVLVFALLRRGQAPIAQRGSRNVLKS